MTPPTSAARYRIAMVTPGPFPAPRGSQVLVRELAEALANAGHRVHVVAYGDGDGSTLPAGVEVHRTHGVFAGSALYGPAWRRLGPNLALLVTLYRLVRDAGIEVIHAHNYEAPVLAYVVRALTGVPVVYHGHNVMSDELERYFESRAGKWAASRLGRALDRSVPRHADYVVALSQPMADFLRDNGVGDRQMAVIPPGVSVDLEAAPVAAHPDPYPGSKVIVYAGNLDPYQDLRTLVRAMVEIRRAEPQALLVIATHAADEWIAPAVARLGLTDAVRVVLASDFDGVRALLQRADLLVCPRTSWSGFPIKLLNYMAAGRAIVIAAGAAAAVQNGPMVVVPNGSPSCLAAAVVATLRDPAGRSRLGEEARRLAAAAFSWPRLLPRFEEVYRTVVKTPPEASDHMPERKKVLQKRGAWELMGKARGRISPARAGLVEQSNMVENVKSL